MIPPSKRPPDADLRRLYVDQKLSSVDIGARLGVYFGTVCKWLRAAGIPRRTPAQGGLDAAWKNIGKKRVFTQEHRDKLRAASLRHGDKHAVGTRITSHGYVEYTRGPNKERLVHVVLMEQKIGRPLAPNEVVHHKDRNRQNNDLETNLELMTRAEHTALHRREDDRIEIERKHREQAAALRRMQGGRS